MVTAALAFALAGCAQGGADAAPALEEPAAAAQAETEHPSAPTAPEVKTPEPAAEPEPQNAAEAPAAEPDGESPADNPGEEQNEAPAQAQEAPAAADRGEAPVEPREVVPSGGGRLVAIDPGHQRRGNSAQEPIGPGASQTKPKVSSGTTGHWTGLAEYELNLTVSLLLRDELEARGYRVVMTRTSHDVDISNIERAQLAADSGADILVRIHANGSDDPSVSGALTICMTPKNPYCAQLYRESRRLSDDVLDGLAAATGAKKRSVWETDTMSGVNWASMPVTIVEMGFMTNEREDRLLATADYQAKMARGIADGIDRYFGQAPALSAAPDIPAQEAPAAEAESLQAVLDRFVQGKGESWDVRAEALSGGASAAAQANLVAGHGSVSASIIKIFIAGAVYEDVEAGLLDHGDVIGDLTLMLQNSDNDATNRLTRKLGGGDAEAGMARVTRFAESIGCGDTRHNRLMLDFSGKENYTSAKDCATALRMLCEGRYVTPAWSAEMLSIMKGQVDRSRIHRLLPKGTVVADKPGSLYERSNGDVGVVFSPAGDYILCMICNDFQSAEAVKDEMARLSLEVYDWFQAHPPQ